MARQYNQNARPDEEIIEEAADEIVWQMGEEGGDVEETSRRVLSRLFLGAAKEARVAARVAEML